jgi:hypothetical protein
MADFLGGMLNSEAGEPADLDAPAEVPAEPQVEAQPEPAAESAPEPAAEPAPEPEAPKDEQRTIPLATALNWRDEAKEYRRRVEQYEAQQRQAPARPDPFDDPEGFAAHQQALVQQAIVQDRFERSNEDAVEKFGEDKVKAAVDWAASRAQQNPSFAAEYMSKTRPIQWIVQQHQRDAMLSEIGDNPDDYFAREAAKRGYVLPSAPVEAAPVAAVVQPAVKPAPPPRSIASERSDAARVTPQGERDGFLASIVGK